MRDELPVSVANGISRCKHSGRSRPVRSVETSPARVRPTRPDGGVSTCHACVTLRRQAHTAHSAGSRRATASDCGPPGTRTRRLTATTTDAPAAGDDHLSLSVSGATLRVMSLILSASEFVTANPFKDYLSRKTGMLFFVLIVGAVLSLGAWQLNEKTDVDLPPGCVFYPGGVAALSLVLLVISI